MSNYQLTKDIVQQVKDIQVRLEAVEKFNPLNDGTIDEGGLAIKDGGISVKFPSGNENVFFGLRDPATRLTGGIESVDAKLGFSAANDAQQLIMSLSTWLSDDYSFAQFGDASPEDIAALNLFTVFADQIYFYSATRWQTKAVRGDLYFVIDPDNVGGAMYFTDFSSGAGQINFSITDLNFYNLATTGSAANARISTSGTPTLQVSTSAKRFKQDIEEFHPPIDTILNIQPKTWRDKNEVLKDESVAKRHFGAIAEDLVDLGLDFLVDFDDDGQPWAIQYERVAIALIPAIKDHRKRLATAEDRLAALEKKVK